MIVAVSGGIAAYKACSVVSSLVQDGAEVTVAMTESATQFVGTATFQGLSGRAVLTSLWTTEHAHDPQHIRLTRDCDLFLIAPATANIIGKLANGICDDVVTTMAVAATCPMLLAPAMNDAMWNHPAVRGNVARLTEFGYAMVGPDEGWLACRSVGPGRMSDPDEIIRRVRELLMID